MTCLRLRYAECAANWGVVNGPTRFSRVGLFAPHVVAEEPLILLPGVADHDLPQTPRDPKHISTSYAEPIRGG
jgi:hypothetical protein